MNILSVTTNGLYCDVGDFYIDPWQPVERAVVTHLHGDHYARGCKSYLISDDSRHIAPLRLGEDAAVQTLAYGEPLIIKGAKVSLHPAGHILGSAQIRVEVDGEVMVVSGDYKREADRTCAPFEVVPCDTFITEATFGLPIYRWDKQQVVFDQINAWWRDNQAQGKTSVIYGYALGKAQRILAGVDSSIGPIYTHGAVETLTEAYRKSGINMPATIYAADATTKDFHDALIVAPPSARGTHWLRRFGDVSQAFVSGWMRIRGVRRQRTVDRGFVLSDHVDWTELMNTVKETSAERIGVTHGYTQVVAQWLGEQGYDTFTVETRFRGEQNEESE
ncbi:MAG: ligase-associated DNA damage response exonuclease [Burkholderiales bacterium]|nr:ligase-associated DNA damage response exonuclease [Anaerolineae bacterium]